MAYTENPKYPKSGPGTKLGLVPGAKRIAVEMLEIGATPNIGKANASRIYTRDYSKIDEVPDTDNVDLVGPALGNPLRI